MLRRSIYYGSNKRSERRAIKEKTTELELTGNEVAKKGGLNIYLKREREREEKNI
jgi:hypothetical protein